MSRYSARFSVAPMMDWTDRRCRAFHRVLTRRARLYTEMVTADAVVFGPRERLIGFERDEHPVVLQRGGPDRRLLRLRRNQSQLRLPVRPGEKRPFRRLPDARTRACRRVRRRDGR